MILFSREAYCKTYLHIQPIVVVEIDFSCVVNKIHATHFWETPLSTLGGAEMGLTFEWVRLS